MTAHRVIETPDQLAALGVGTVIIDSDRLFPIGELRANNGWVFAGLGEDPVMLDEIALPARVLLEAWER